jgi:hypothetical protein
MPASASIASGNDEASIGLEKQSLRLRKGHVGGGCCVQLAGNIHRRITKERSNDRRGHVVCGLITRAAYPP